MYILGPGNSLQAYLSENGEVQTSFGYELRDYQTFGWLANSGNCIEQTRIHIDVTISVELHRRRGMPMSD